jgi:hypothetical protein
VKPTLPVGGVQAFLQSESDVVDLQPYPGQPGERAVPEVVLGLQRPGPVVLDEPVVQRVVLGGGANLAGGVVAHRLVQPEAGDPVQVLPGYQRLVDQRRQLVQHGA